MARKGLRPQPITSQINTVSSGTPIKVGQRVWRIMRWITS